MSGTPSLQQILVWAYLGVVLWDSCKFTVYVHVLLSYLFLGGVERFDSVVYIKNTCLMSCYVYARCLSSYVYFMRLSWHVAKS